MEEIKKILFSGTDSQRKYLFSFDEKTNPETIVKKFNVFARFFYPKFFKSKDAPFHHDLLIYLARLYISDNVDDFLNIGFRGCSKTTFIKLFITFCIANDTIHRRRYFKILSEDIKNSKQITTDIYNLLIQPKVAVHYPEIFAETDFKREETMDRFTTSTGVKVISGSLGQEQRGQIQEESRPDFLYFDDFESRNTLRSAVKTHQIWDNMQEATNGLAKGGATVYSCNYISERGNVHRLVEKIKHKMIIPILDDKGNPTWDRFSLSDIEKIKEKAEDFEGEFMCRPSASKDVLFDRESVEKQIPKVPLRTIANFKIFKEYNPSHRIAGGADVAGGLGLDSSTSCHIDFDFTPAQVVGTYHNNEIRPDDFGHELIRQGNMFGQCLLAPENNKYDETIGILKLNYPMSKIYATQKSNSRITYGNPTTFGWSTNSLTKTQMFNALAKAVEEGLIELNDEDLIREARSYTRNDVMDGDVDPRMATRHFDLLTACAIAWQMKDFAKKGSQAKEFDPFEEIFDKQKNGKHNTDYE